jgi:hypothetical protein
MRVQPPVDLGYNTAMNPLDALTVAAPSLAVALIALILGRRAIRHFLKSSHEERPLVPCPKCGYDLQATLFQCPECGTQLLWGQLPGDQRAYDAYTRRLERRELRMRAASR